MKIRELLRLLLRPLAGLCLFFCIQSFFAHYTNGLFRFLDHLNATIDICGKRTVGVWFETLFFALTGISFFMVSRHPALPKYGKNLLVLMALGFCFLSVDEMMSLRDFVGYQLEQATGIVKGTRLEHRGYSWVLLYASVALVACSLVSGLYYRITKTSWNRSASICYLLAWLVVELVVLCEVAAAWGVLERIDLSIISCFEKSFELAFLLFFYSANLLIAEDIGL